MPYRIEECHEICEECGEEVVCEISVEDPWPDKEWVDFNNVFDEMGNLGSEKYGLLWLEVNQWIAGAMIGSGVDHSYYKMRWLGFKIALRVCAELKRQEEAIEAND